MASSKNSDGYSTSRQKAKKKKSVTKGRAQRRKLGKVCSFYTKAGKPCKAAVCHTDELGRNFCVRHKKALDAGTIEDYESVAAQAMIDEATIKHHKNVVIGLDPVTGQTGSQVDAINEAMDQVDDPDTMGSESYKVQKAVFNGDAWVRRSSGTMTHGKNSGFIGIDIDYYTPDYKPDHFYLLNAQIRRVHACINMTMQQLLRLEEERDLIKQVETYGTQVLEGKVVDFKSIMKRHSEPYRLTNELMATLAKHEKNYKELLKQKEETLINALQVLRKFNVRWDREAGQMVAEAIERKDQQELEAHGAIDVTAKDAELEAPATDKEDADAIEEGW